MRNISESKVGITGKVEALFNFEGPEKGTLRDKGKDRAISLKDMGV